MPNQTFLKYNTPQALSRGRIGSLKIYTKCGSLAHLKIYTKGCKTLPGRNLHGEVHDEKGVRSDDPEETDPNICQEVPEGKVQEGEDDDPG